MLNQAYFEVMNQLMLIPLVKIGLLLIYIIYDVILLVLYMEKCNERRISMIINMVLIC